MNLIINYWAQLTVIIGIIGYIIKTILDYRIKNKELKFKYFYELKSKKIIELYTKIVELQIIIDRRKKGEEPTFESNVFRKRKELDQYYWESEFYFSKKTKKIFRTFSEWLVIFEAKEVLTESPDLENQFQKITNALIQEFKKEIK